MIILGINYFFHDSSACLVKDGELLVALEEERFSRQKHTMAFPELAIARCLEVAGLDYQHIDHVAVSIDPNHNAGAKLLYGLKHLRRSAPFIRHEVVQSYFKQRNFKAWYQRHFAHLAKPPAVHNIQHHLCHAVGSYLVSPYEEAALLGMDGAGEWATTWLGQAKGTNYECFGESFFPHSLGSFYEAVTEFCGFKPNYDEGKTMGLAPMGDPDRFYDKVAQLVQVDDNGRVHIDLRPFNYQHWGWQRCNQRFYDLFGQPRARDGEFEPHHLDVAAAFQRVLEDRALTLSRQLKKKTGMRHLVISGGVSLNSVMNGRIVRETDFDDVYVMPAAGDNGTAIGAAYYAHNVLLGQSKRFVHNNPYVGTEYSNEQIDRYLRQCKLTAHYHEHIEDAAADLLQAGKIIGWFQDKMEIGPRALGSRSILANPTLPDMKDKINAEVKHREAYRPFAPSALVECRQEYFDIDVEAPFMLKVCDVKESAKDKLPAITHVDGSARLQTVREEISPRYYRLIKAFGERSGVPVVLNTSFNIMGEPVVESPEQAVRCFFSTGLDALVIGNYIIEK